VRQLHPESLDGSATSLFEFLSEQVADPRFRNGLIETFAQMTSHLIHTDGTH
jgi:hypothetical protein